MTPVFPRPGPRAVDACLLLARLLLALIFLHEGVTLTTHFDGASAAFAKLGIPPFLLILTILLQLAGGMSLAAGLFMRLGAAGLGLFCIATALQIHTNFAVQNEVLQFEKDLGLAGGMLALLVCGPGQIALDSLVAARVSSLRWLLR